MFKTTEILVICTHFPYGNIEENWIEPEIDEFSRRFDRVHILPVKELDIRREVPADVDCWPPLATRNRLGFFAKHALFPRTWSSFVRAMRECVAGPGVTITRVIVSFKFACYRTAFERNPHLNRFLGSDCNKVVYAYWGHLPALAVPKAHKLGAGTCVRYHAGDLYVHRPEIGGFFPWRKELRDASDLNAFISEHGMAYFLDQPGGAPRGNCGVFRLGSRDNGPPNGNVRSGANAPIVMASASWIDPVKRVEQIAELAGELARTREVTWHHFGSGESATLDAQIAKAQALGARVVLHGKVKTEDLQAFYRENAITFFVNLSRDEGIPVSIMEALNADIPVVATAVGGTPEVVLPGRSGILVPADIPGGAAALAIRVSKELQPGGLLAGSKPRDVWEELCDAGMLTKAFCTKLLELAK